MQKDARVYTVLEKAIRNTDDCLRVPALKFISYPPLYTDTVVTIPSIVAELTVAPCITKDDTLSYPDPPMKEKFTILDGGTICKLKKLGAS
jgi:hypothetical protein